MVSNKLPLKIAIVDDDKNMLRTMGVLLESRGYDVSLFHAGATAAVDVPEEQPDCVITDINMVGMDGLKLMRELRANPLMATTRFIAVTGQSGDDWREKALEAGAIAFITKPFEPENFISQIETNLI